MVDRFIDTLTARQAGRSPQQGGDREVMLQLGLTSERLAAALDARDLETLIALAEHLHAVAMKHEWAEIAERASEINDAASADDGLGRILQSTHDILDLCQSAQNDFIESLKDPASETETKRRKVA